jgi:hypothetical protein
MKKLIIMVASLAMVAGFAMTAAAADWNFYGSSRISTFHGNVDGIDSNTQDTDFFDLNLQGNSRIGANVKVSDELSGRFEYGTGVNTRLLYGTWNFGSGALTIGQTYSPLNMFTSGQVFGSDTGLLNVGGVYSGREPLLQLAFGGFKIALVELNHADNVASTYDENSFPAIEARYRYVQDNWNIEIAGGYQTYEAQNTATFGDLDIDSYVVALGGGVNFGALYVKANVYTGTNGGNLIALNTTGTGWAGGGLAGLNAAGNDVDDNDMMGYVLVVGGKINDMFSVEGGYSHAEQELDSSTTGEDEVSSYYLNSTITLAPGVFVVPEVGMIDGDEDGDVETTYFGAKWQINF